MSDRAKGQTLTIRICDQRRARLDAAVERMTPYKPSLTSVVERGIDLAIIELEALAETMKESE